MKQDQEYYEEERDNPEEESEEEEEFHPVPDDRKESARSFTQIQIVACAAVLIAAVILRTLGGSFYQTAKTWYLAAVGDSVLPEEQVENIQHTVISLWSSVSNLRPNGLSVSSQAVSSDSEAQSGISSAAESGVSSGTASGASEANPSSAAASSGNAGSVGSAPNSAAP